MKIKIPKWALISAGSVLVLSLIPSVEIRMVFSALADPFIWFYTSPLVCNDKPWFLTYAGAVVTGLLWAALILTIASGLSVLKNHKRNTRTK
jgi:hypothetical protein